MSTNHLYTIICMILFDLSPVFHSSVVFPQWKNFGLALLFVILQVLSFAWWVTISLEFLNDGFSVNLLSVCDTDVLCVQVQPVIHPMCEVCHFNTLYPNQLHKWSQSKCPSEPRLHIWFMCFSFQGGHNEYFGGLHEMRGVFMLKLEGNGRVSYWCYYNICIVLLQSLWLLLLLSPPLLIREHRIFFSLVCLFLHF